MPDNLDNTAADSNAEAGSLSIDDAASRAIDSMSEEDAPSSNEDNASTQSDTREASEASKVAPEEEALDWDKLPPKAKRAYEEANKKYENFRSMADKKFTEWKQQEKLIKDYEQKAKRFDEIDGHYTKNPKLKETLDEIYGLNQNKLAPELEADPAIKMLREYQARVDAQLNPIVKHYQTETQAREQQKIETQIDAMTKVASDEFKTYFGREPSNDDMAKIYTTMTEKQVYDGSAAVRAAFFEEIMGARIQKTLEDQTSKKNKVTRSSNVNTSKLSSSGKTLSHAEAIELAFQEHNIQF